MSIIEPNQFNDDLRWRNNKFELQSGLITIF
jgi:hypothetical protein